MKNSLLFCVLLIITLLPHNLFAQAGYKVKFSEEIKFRGEERCYTDDIIGEDENHIYVLLTEKPFQGYSSTNQQITIQQFDKQSLRPKNSVKIFADRAEARDYSIRSIFQTEKGFVVFLQTNKRSKYDLYAMRYDFDLHALQKRKKIYSYDEKEEENRLMQRPGSEEFALLSQKFVEEGEQIVVDYSIFDEELFLINSSQLELALQSKLSKRKASRQSANVLDDLYYIRTGDLVLLASLPNKDGHEGGYSLQFINPKTNEVIDRPVKLSNDAYFDATEIIILDNEVILTGFYSDEVERKKRLSKKTYSTSNFNINGTFLLRYDIETRQLTTSTQAPFDSEFTKYISDHNPAIHVGVSLFGKKKKKAAAHSKGRDDISGNYRIQKVIFDEVNKTATFFCEYAKNTVTTSTHTDANGNTTTSTTYHSQRGNLFYFDISLTDGTMNWYNSIRKYSYLSGGSYVWDQKTIDVFPSETGAFIIFRSDRIFSSANRSDMRGEKVKTKKVSQNFFTATVNKKDGEYQLEAPKMLDKSPKPYHRIQLENTTWLSTYDQTLYTINSMYTRRPGLTALIVSTYVLCVGYYIGQLHPKKWNETFTIARLSY